MLLSLQKVELIDQDRITRSVEAFEQIVERLAAHPAPLQNLLEFAGSENTDDTSSTPMDSLVPEVPSPHPRTGSTYLKIRTSVNTSSCDKYCNCQYHVQSHIATLRWL